MNDQALIIRDDAHLTVSFTDGALALKESILANTGLIAHVNDGDEQKVAVAAQQDLAGLLNRAEKARKAAKEPVLQFGRAIDDAAKVFCRELKEEQVRLAELVGSFQQLEQKRIEAARRAENERLSALERERARALAEAKTMDEVDAVQEQFDRKTRDAAPPVEAITPARVEGQRIHEEWNITVTDIWLLAKAHPACVKIEPRLSEIKTLLNAGVKVAGVTATRELRASVLANSRAAIDV